MKHYHSLTLIVLALSLSCNKVVVSYENSSTKEKQTSVPSSSQETIAAELSSKAWLQLFGSETRSNALPPQVLSVQSLTVSGTRSPEKDPAYVVNFSQDKGFSIVKFSNNAPFITAISDQGNIDSAVINNPSADEEHKALYSVVAKTLDSRGERTRSSLSDTTHAHLFVDFLEEDPDSVHVITGEWMQDDNVFPLVEFKWGQGYPYNQHMPLVSQSHLPYYSNDRYRGRYAVGCVPLAVTALMATIQQPTSFLGHIGVYYWYEFATIGRYYNYANFLYNTFDDYADDYTWIKTDKLADMLAMVSGSFESRVFESNGTFFITAESIDVLENLASYCYAYGECRYVDDQEMLDAAIYATLYNGSPMIIRGNGHAWLLDGLFKVHRHVASDSIETLKLYHFNWGWNGFADGYYLYDDFRPALRLEQDVIDTNTSQSTSYTNYYDPLNSYVIFFMPYHG